MALRTILLKGRGIRKELLAAAAITPGYLVERDVNGKVAKHSVAGGPFMPAFAVENELLGSEITVDWASGDQTVFEVMPPGAEIYALLAASALAVVIGDKLESAGDGTLRIASEAGAQATVVIGTGDAAVTYLANQIGLAGNDITIEYLTATAATATIVVTGTAIVIKPDDTTPGTTDQADDIITLVNADPEASSLVTAHEGAGDGTDPVVEPVAATNLAGGAATNSGNFVAEAIEAVDNSGGGSEARLQVEIL